MLQCCVRSSVVVVVVCDAMYCGTVRPTAKVNIGSLYEVVYEKSIGTIASHSPLNITETVRDRGLVPKYH